MARSVGKNVAWKPLENERRSRSPSPSKRKCESFAWPKYLPGTAAQIYYTSICAKHDNKLEKSTWSQRISQRNVLSKKRKETSPAQDHFPWPPMSAPPAARGVADVISTALNRLSNNVELVENPARVEVGPYSPFHNLLFGSISFLALFFVFRNLLVACRVTPKESPSRKSKRAPRKQKKNQQVQTTERALTDQKVDGTKQNSVAWARSLVTGQANEGGGNGATLDNEENESSEFGPNILGGGNLAGVFSPTTEYTLTEIDKMVVIVAGGVVVTWITLLILVYGLTPSKYFRPLTSAEYNASVLGGVIKLVSLINKTTPLMIKCKRHGPKCSGVLIGAFTVQSIAMATEFLMAMTPVPIVSDPFLGLDVFMTRYCEWIPVAFMMTFLTECVDATDFEPIDKDANVSARPWMQMKLPLLSATAQSISALQGLVMPLCPGKISWYASAIISFALFFMLFPRLYVKAQRFRKLRKEEDHFVGQALQYDRARLAYLLISICSVIWTAFVVVYFAELFVPPLRMPGSSLRLMLEACMDMMSKVMYLNIIMHVHQTVFDDGARAALRLEELRRLMSVVWENSSDAIVISVKSLDNKVSTMLSPTVLQFGGVSHESVPNDLTAVVIDQTLPEYLALTEEIKDQRTPVRSGYYFIDISDGGRVLITDPKIHDATREGLCSVLKLMGKAWQLPSENLLAHDIVREDGKVVHCEAQLTRFQNNTIVAVVRDISERCMRFEAEKIAVSETTARIKDAQANRFTRHEVKNGLLAAMALCDGIRDSVCGGTLSERMALPSGTEAPLPISASVVKPSNNISREEKTSNGQEAQNSTDSSLYRLGVSGAITELDSTLREVLDTVLAEAMARDVIHEVYEPKMERVDLQSILCCPRAYGESTLSRFPLVTNPSPLPIFIFDPQLLRYIHRNAVSNACKYGRKGGVVLTEVRYHAEDGKLEMNVINLPGEDHDRLLELGDSAAEAVFSPGTRLHRDSDVLSDDDGGQTVHSSGDGAWISKKCATSFGGDCSIRFEKERTVFTLTCSATTFTAASRRNPASGQDPSKFRLPEGTWGIAIDDSKIQRKLMHRLFSLVEIPEERQIVLGKDAEEIQQFTQTVLEQVKCHSKAYFLLLADENLDVLLDDTCHRTISGSLCIQKLRAQLNAEDERRVLCLVRSANDSASDIAIYKSRAHGFFPKAPIKRDKVIEMLAPLWVQRFPETFAGDGNIQFGPGDVVDLDVFVASAADLMQTLEVIDALCFQNEALLVVRWPVIWEKLHALKGDLKTLERTSLVSEVLKSIDAMRGPILPDDFVSKWRVIRGVIVTIIRC